MGDFNCIANLDERIGQRPRSHEVEPLRRCMETCDLHDMKSTGRFFTWSNKQEGVSRVLSKIDRVMSNQLWDDTFPTPEAVFLPEGDFDHTPMLVQFFKQHQRNKPFKFFNHWGKRENFLSLIQGIWNYPAHGPKSFLITQKLKRVKQLCRDKFKKDEHAHVVEAEANLLCAQQEVHAHPTNIHIINLEGQMDDLLKKAKEERDSTLHQKAKIAWLTMGDENTKYFHHSHMEYT